MKSGYKKEVCADVNFLGEDLQGHYVLILGWKILKAQKTGLPGAVLSQFRGPRQNCITGPH